MTKNDRSLFLFLNIGHFLDHFFLLIFATAAALALTTEWQISYGDLLPYGTAGFAAFALFSWPAGWLADKWGRHRMITVFFAGIGISAILTGLARNPMEIGIGLFFLGVFAAIYHPVGLAIVTARWRNVGMRLAVNGVWGNLGVGAAALITGLLIDMISWRAAFILPGAISVLLAWPYARIAHHTEPAPTTSQNTTGKADGTGHNVWRLGTCIFLTAAVGGMVFQSTTVALPEVFDTRLADFARDLTGYISLETATMLGVLVFIVFAAASLAQLVTGHMLDRLGARPVLLSVAGIQLIFLAAMPGAEGLTAFVIALGFMIGVFGQIPINDFLIGTMVAGRYRARAFGLRYLLTFISFSTALPLIAGVQGTWGFDGLFRLMAVFAAVILPVALLLPGRGRTGRRAQQAA